jgi:hypothetical protein
MMWRGESEERERVGDADGDASEWGSTGGAARQLQHRDASGGR